MSDRYSKKHVRRQSEAAHQEWVSIDEAGLCVEVHPPHWKTPRTFDFGLLEPYAGHALARQIALAFGLFATRFSRRTAEARFEGFADLCRTVSAQLDEGAPSTNLRTGEHAARWSAAAHDYLVQQYKCAAKQTSAKTKVQNIQAVLDDLASCGLVATVKAADTPKNLHLKKTPRPGLFELSSNSKKPTPDEKSELLRHFREIGVPIEDDEGEAFIEQFATVLTPDELRDPRKINEVYLNLTNEYLEALKTAAETQYLKWCERYSQGRIYLSLGNPGVLQAFDEGLLSGDSYAEFRRFFPKRNETTATANFLLLVRERYKGRVPSIETLDQPLRSRVLSLMRELGGTAHLDAMLTLHREGVAAAAILYIVDTGANLSTALSLEIDFERPTSEPGVVEFFAVKARANYKAIYDYLLVNDPGRRISTVKALRGVAEMTANLRSSFPELGRSLFVFRFFGTPSLVDAQFMRRQFANLLKSANLPPRWTMSGIRVAVGVADALDGTGTLSNLKRTLHHGRSSMATTLGYALRWPVRRSLELDMAKYQRLLQAGLASNVACALEWLHRSREEADRLLEEAKEKGLGFLVAKAKPLGSAEVEDDPASTEAQPDDCCEVRVFVTDEESLAEVIATNSSLKANLTRLEKESTARFDEFWTELMAFTEAVIAEAKESAYAYLMPRAAHKADELIAAGFDITGLRP